MVGVRARHQAFLRRLAALCLQVFTSVDRQQRLHLGIVVVGQLSEVRQFLDLLQLKGQMPVLFVCVAMRAVMMAHTILADERALHQHIQNMRPTLRNGAGPPESPLPLSHSVKLSLLSQAGPPES
jgi:hypothetical protein